ncbi:MarR family winged helix-turn-helix transcriptional regulator [Amycolatopsis minnesotensis]|uniref:MarR family transcriptional regulator n=1 Tax=Amycolatopsis minnesotensis TaxID=337894 RepID=A0ABN2QYC3_9PSEU
MHDRTANLLGATALAVADLTLGEATKATGLSASGASALVVLAGSPEVSVTELGKRVGLTQSAAARMVDSLESAGLAKRHAGRGRAVAVRLTAGGREAARSALTARGTPLAGLLDGLDAEQRDTLAGLLEILLSGAYDRVRDAELLCRLCDRASCTADAVCPVGQAERDAARCPQGTP